MNWDERGTLSDYYRKWAETQERLAKMDRQGAPVEHRTPSPITAYASLDHFLFLPDLHWNGRTVDL